MSDLRSLVIGIVGGIISGPIAYYATRAIDRYLVRRTVRSRLRQIKQLTEELALLEKLGVADRALLLFGFQALFALIGVAAVCTAGAVVLFLVEGVMEPVFVLFAASAVALVAFYAASVFRKLEDPAPTLEKLRRRVRELEGIDDESSTGGKA
jgi:hypothetical protein